LAIANPARCERSADCQSAKQQVANLRYEDAEFGTSPASHLKAAENGLLVVLNNHYTSFGQLFLGFFALLSLWIVAYLIRLQFRQIRKNRRMAEKGLEFGLIQNVTGSTRPVVKIPAPVLTQAHSVTATVSALGISYKRWTGSAEIGAPTHRWN
jgi:hypothetical protein